MKAISFLNRFHFARHFSTNRARIGARNVADFEDTAEDYSLNK